MPDRFPPLARHDRQPDKARTKAIARAMPAPSVPLLDMLIFGVLVVLIRWF